VDNLRNLLIIRSIALLGQTGVLIYVLLASRTTESLLGVSQPGRAGAAHHGQPVAHHTALAGGG
jgi:hypothetical protein